MRMFAVTVATDRDTGTRNDIVFLRLIDTLRLWPGPKDTSRRGELERGIKRIALTRCILGRAELLKNVRFNLNSRANWWFKMHFRERNRPYGIPRDENARSN